MSPNPTVITGTIDDVRAFLHAVQDIKSFPATARVLAALDLDACKASPEAVNILTPVLLEHPIVAWDDITITTWTDIEDNIARLEEQRRLFVTMLTIATKIEGAIAAGGPIHFTMGEPEPHEISLWSPPQPSNNIKGPTLVRMSGEAVRAWWKTSDSYDFEEYNAKVDSPTNEAATGTNDDVRSGVDGHRQNTATETSDDVNADNAPGSSRLPKKKNSKSAKKRAKNKKRVKSN